MKKKAILRGLLGFPLGIAIGYIITIFISLGWADGQYVPCVPELVAAMGNEINAVILQTLLCGLMGAGFAAISILWEIGSWSRLKQTGIYFIAASILMFPTAYFLYWMEHSVMGFIDYFGIFAVTFAFIWAIQMVTGKLNVKKMNDHLRRIKGREEE